MYIRRIKLAAGYHYVLRETYRDRNVWRHRDIMDLGDNPDGYIEYPGGKGYYFQEDFEERLRSQRVEYSSEELERVFLPFMRPEVRAIIERFQFRGAKPPGNQWNRCSSQELLTYQQELHSFDKRRLHFLRCGRIDIGELEGRPWKFLNVLLGKSRDEIEHTLEEMERVLRPQEYKAYVFTAFHLQAYFPHHLLRNHPSALDPEKLDGLFLDRVCHLNEDPTFFRGVERHNPRFLHDSLVKYVILYFDHAFDGDGWGDWLENLMRRGHPWSRQVPMERSVSREEACANLGITTDECRDMDERDLMRLYHEKAKEAHPDMGGDHESFVNLKKAYESLLANKRGVKGRNP